MKRFTWISLGVLVVLLAILAIGDLDYTISSSIINEDSIWAEFFNMFGELPAMAGLLLAATLLFGGRNKDVKWKNITWWIFGVLFIVLFSFAVAIMPVNYAFEHAEDGIPTIWMGVVVLIAITLSVTAIVLAQKYGSTMRELRKHALLFVALIVGEIVIVNVLKGVWARPRMRSITDVSEFKHWYEIAGWTNDNELKSFPSGHTANGFVALAYLIFLPFVKTIKPRIYIAFAITWGVLVALSRVVLGAHFLSDVLVGGYITIFLFLFLNRMFFQTAVE